MEAVKYYAERENRSTNNFIETVLKKIVKMDYPISKNIPNQETINAIKEESDNLKLYDNFKDLLKDV